MRDPPNVNNIFNFIEVKNLEIIGVQEMDAMEMVKTEGGFIGVGPLWWNAGIRASGLRYTLFYDKQQAWA